MKKALMGGIRADDITSLWYAPGAEKILCPTDHGEDICASPISL